TIFYILRRVTGTLIWAMVLHGLWDFSTFSSSHGVASPIAGLTGILYLVTGLFALVAVWWTLRSRDAAVAPVGTAGAVAGA
ncbi:hypothetical protein ACC691_38780, partial [Rhizobium johnstonii]|uniref:hypothetical protein n=1 Tax=Rhizobium johnstonii TaxID=3019933 RepID=UPI003F9762DA